MTHVARSPAINRHLLGIAGNNFLRKRGKMPATKACFGQNIDLEHMLVDFNRRQSQARGRALQTNIELLKTQGRGAIQD
ncbi:hypothetical protein [Aquamicrobium sp. LC103]|uniref:hypothetical protein n=1 Tax=Aquamicrobium sp. LC103 TaxID=1120658 RepID=UPI00109D3EB6|nr:hypothetical protein [Aquamicrobium sp. LC103]TKT74694.1 hypothetical protein XW59_022460 [Aquamicrobium sp. LC103]